MHGKRAAVGDLVETCGPRRLVHFTPVQPPQNPTIGTGYRLQSGCLMHTEALWQGTAEPFICASLIVTGEGG